MSGVRQRAEELVEENRDLTQDLNALQHKASSVPSLADSTAHMGSSPHSPLPGQHPMQDSTLAPSEP